MAVVTKDFHEAFLAAKADLERREVNLSRRHYVIVPDKCSLFCEQLLFGSRGALDAEVLTFGRLYQRFYKGGESYLPKSGAVMLLIRILSRLKKQLSVFAKSVDFVGLAEKMYEAIGEAQQTGLSPRDLAGGTDAAGLKLNDIALVYAEYQKETAGKFVDTDGRTALLAKALLKTDLSADSFYIAGFDRITAVERRVLEILKHGAAKVIEYETAAPENRFGTAEFYRADSVADRVKAIAVRIRAEIIESFQKNPGKGYRYRDFCVLGAGNVLPAVTRIFTEFEIPHYIDQKQRLSESALARYLTLCAEAGSLRREKMIALSKNYYAGIDRRKADAFEDYAVSRAVNYAGFCRAFETDTDAESVRQELLRQITAFQNRMSAVQSAADFPAFVQGVFADCNAGEKTAELEAVKETDLSQIPEKLLATADLLPFIAQECKKTGELFKLFTDGVRTTSISLSAPVSDAVVVGGAETFRGGRFRAVFVADFTEDSVPQTRKASGLIGEPEARLLESRGVTAPISLQKSNEYSTAETVRLFASAQKLFLAYPDDGGSKLSFLSNAVQAGAAVCINSSAREERKAMKGAFCEIGKTVSCGSNALELLVSSEAAVSEGLSGLPFAAELKAVLNGREAPYCARIGKKIFYPLTGAAELFFYKSRVSVSRLTAYFECPYKSFAKNALRLQEKKDGEFSAPEIGRFLHSAVEAFVHKNEFDNPKKAMAEVVEELKNGAFSGFYKTARLRFARAGDEALRLAFPVAALSEASAFRTALTEARFGFGDGGDKLLKTLSWNIAGNHLSLAGVIDRVDVFENYCRIIDYKSGNKNNAKFSAKQLYYGTQLQLPLYLKVLLQNGYAPAGMFYFPLSADFTAASSGHFLSGVLNGEDDLPAAFDAALSKPDSVSRILPARTNKNPDKKTGRAVLRAGAGQTDTAGLYRLLDYAERVVSLALSEIHSGFITPAPLDKACRFCKMSGICGFDPEKDEARKSQAVTLADITEAV